MLNHRLAGGLQQSCALTDLGELKCWGDNAVGSIGDGTKEQRRTPVIPIGMADGVRSIAAGGRHTCAVLKSAQIYCWGQGDRGQVGDGAGRESVFPSEVASIEGSGRYVATGEFHSCAILGGGTVKCWGSNFHGELGGGTPPFSSNVPVDVIGLRGDNRHGQLGDGSLVNRSQPVRVAGLSSSVEAVSTGWGHTCALMNSGRAKCWGDNELGQLGNGGTTDSLVPATVNGPLLSDIALGSAHSCARAARGKIYCWGGGNANGQVGIGEIFDNQTVPVRVRNF